MPTLGWSSAKPKFQVLSDLHLEICNQYSTYTIPVRAPNLILAGDIGRLADYTSYLSFVTRQCAQFALVFLVLGNHEFYGTSRSEGLRLAQKLQSESALNGRLVVLHQRRFDVGDVMILGCTLNSRVTPAAEKVVGMAVADFRRIGDWTVAQHNEAFDEDVRWLREQVRLVQRENNERKLGNEDRQAQILVVTHHAPALRGTSRSSQEGSAIVSAFATDLVPGLGDFVGVDCWVYGHTHYSNAFKLGGVRLISNQRGYVLPSPQQPERRKNWGKWISSFKTTLLRSSYFPAEENLFDVEKAISV
ncbi:MAG: hypothetical protein LQ340_003159 [Diploschistes diacapsis]|nr:MAG: hypothetical protein LQ340_003159 [Diploschistes diacapsis]